MSIPPRGRLCSRSYSRWYETDADAVRVPDCERACGRLLDFDPGAVESLANRPDGIAGDAQFEPRQPATRCGRGSPVPGVQPDVVVVVAGGDEQRPVPLLADGQVERVDVEAACGGDVGDFEVNVADVCFGWHALRIAFHRSLSERVQVEWKGIHLDATVANRPLPARPVAVHLDAVVLGVPEVQRLADVVVRGAGQLPTVLDTDESLSERGPRRDANGRMKESGVGSRACRRVWRVVQFEQRRPAGTQHRTLVVPALDVEADDGAVEVDEPVEVGHAQRDPADGRVRGECRVGVCHCPPFGSQPHSASPSLRPSPEPTEPSARRRYADAMDLRFLGGVGEVGRSALLVNGRLLLDYGMKTATPPQFPVGLSRGGGAAIDPEAVVASHGHLDHVGAIPSLLSGDRRPPVHWTPPTRELALTLARDTLKLHGGTYDCPFTRAELARVTQVSETHGYREPFEVAGHEVTFFNAGHIPGSAHVLVDDGETRLLYTGDFHTDDHRGTDAPASHTDRPGEPIRGQRLVAGTTARPAADVVVTESTYSDVSHPDRDRIEGQFAESVKTTLWEGGTVVVPAFAIGRTQEMLLICEAHDIPCYVDGMGTGVTEMLRRHPDFLRDPEALRRAKSHARFVTGRDGQRARIADENAAIVTTSGMLSGGPAMSYIPEIRRNPTNKIALTGYQVEGTPGRDLLETGSAEIDGRRMPVAAQVEQYDFSAHADREGLFAFLDSYRDARVLVVHGDRCGAFAEELRDAGVDATAPTLGDELTL
jgi:putative mRNA 3-end processing factor